MSSEKGFSSQEDGDFNTKVTVTLGSLFNQQADLLIIPRSAQGTLSDSFREGLDALNPAYLRQAQTTSKLGDLILNKSSQTSPPGIAYATSVTASESNETSIQQLGQKIVNLAIQNGFKTVVIPLLGTGEGNLDPKLVYDLLYEELNKAPTSVQFRIVIYEIEHYESIAGRKLSATVRQMAKNLINKNTCTSAELVADILSRHSEYGSRSAAKVRSDLSRKPFPSDEQPLIYWFEDLFRLLDAKRVPELHGRVVIAGLCIIDDALRRQLLEGGFLEKILGELTPPLESFLMTDELSVYQQVYPDTIKIPFDQSVFLSDGANINPNSSINQNPVKTENSDVNTNPIATKDTNNNLNKILNNDAWATKDLLGYELYATAISGMIVEENNQTQPPLTVAILAPWGQGKTTLMRYIENDIRDRREAAIVTKNIKTTEPVTNKSQLQKAKDKLNEAPAKINDLLAWVKEPPQISQPIPFPTVWFNPWKHQNSEQVWAGMALSIINQLVDYLKEEEKEKFWFQLNLKRININVIKNRIYRNIVNEFLSTLSTGFVVVSFALFFACIGLGLWITNVLSADKIGTLATSVFSLFGLSLPSIAKFRESRETVLGESLKKSFADVVTEPNYESRVGYFQEVETDLARVFDLLVSAETPAVIFIDDLDRCSPDVTAEVIEAINQIINGSYSSKCYFVIGMDAKMVAASLDKKYSGLVEKLKDEKNQFGNIGYYFLDKFIQLPFVLPVLDDTVRRSLLNNLFVTGGGEKRDEAPLNPKEVKMLAAYSNDSTGNASQEEVGELVKNSQEARKIFIEERVKKNLNDSPEIVEQLQPFVPYLGSSPRALKRFVNMFRFYYSYQELRKLEKKPSATPSALAKWLLLSVRCPQLVRFIQREKSDLFVHSADPRLKAERFDTLMLEFKTQHLQGKQDSLQPKNIQAWYEAVTALTIPEFEWLKDEDVLSILLNDPEGDGKLVNAITCNVW